MLCTNLYSFSTHFIDTVKGITTLRAFGEYIGLTHRDLHLYHPEPLLILEIGFLPDDLQKNSCLINSSQRPAYLLVMIQQWLNLVLDLVVMVMAAILTTLAVRLPSTNSGFTGASLVTLMSFGENLSGFVIFYTRLETSIGAIARLKTFNETVTAEDKDDEDIVPPEQWPQRGVIEFQNVSAHYS